MKGILMISYQFPPDTGSIQRILSHLRYLPQYGWRPIILTHKSNKILDLEIDKEFRKDGINVHRTGKEFNFKSIILKKIESSNSTYGQPKTSITIKGKILLKIKNFLKYCMNLIIWPDSNVWWIPFALLKSCILIRKEKIRNVYIVTPPHSASIIGYFLKKTFKINLILDFRDPWANDVDIIMPTALHRISHKFAEKLVVNASNAVITTTDYHRKYFLKKISSNSKTKVFTITNGVDLQLFKTITPSQSVDFSITYTGNFDSSRNPKSFLKAVSNIRNNNPEIFKTSSINFYGNINPVVQEEINSLELTKVVKQYGLLSFDKVVYEISKATILLLIVHNDLNTSNFCIPAKLFEYMATGRPILAITPEGASRQIIDNYKLGQCVEHSDVFGIEQAIVNYYNLYKTRNLMTNKLDKEILEQFDRKFLTKKLVDILNNLEQ